MRNAKPLSVSRLLLIEKLHCTSVTRITRREFYKWHPKNFNMSVSQLFQNFDKHNSTDLNNPVNTNTPNHCWKRLIYPSNPKPLRTTLPRYNVAPLSRRPVGTRYNGTYQLSSATATCDWKTWRWCVSCLTLPPLVKLRHFGAFACDWTSNAVPRGDP